MSHHGSREDILGVLGRPKDLLDRRRAGRGLLHAVPPHRPVGRIDELDELARGAAVGDRLAELRVDAGELEVADPAVISGAVALLAAPTAPRPALEEGGLDCIVLFVTTRAELATAAAAAVRAMAPTCSLWIAWPKQLSGYSTDITAEVVQAAGLRYGLLDARRLSVNDAWTAMRFIVRMDDRAAWAKRSFDE